MTVRRVTAFLLPAAIAAVAIALVLAPAASAVWVTAGGHKIDEERLAPGPGAEPSANVFASPLDEAFKNIEYHGGEVASSLSTYTIFWDPSGADSYPAGYETGVNQFFGDIEHDTNPVENGQSVIAQYNAPNVNGWADYDPRFGGGLADTEAFPANGCKESTDEPVAGTTCLTENQIVEEIEKFITAKKLPNSFAAMYFVMLPPGVATCNLTEESSGHPQECSIGTKHSVYCTYHSYGGGGFLFSPQVYTVGSGCGSSSRPNGLPSDGEASQMEHELDEAITDPHVSAWLEAKTEGENGEGEVGDLCNLDFTSTGTAPNGQGYDMVINGHYYSIQSMWSDDGHSCKTSLSASEYSRVSPVPAFSSSQVATNEMSYTAIRSPFAVADYYWSLGDGEEVETTSATLTHTYAKGTGPYRVALTEFTSNGTPIAEARNIGVNQPTIEKAAATNLGPASATLNGRVNPNGAALSSCVFDYGTTTSYGKTASCPDIGAVNTPTTVSAAIAGLSPTTTYHYALLAKNAGGETKGEDDTFTTTKALAPTVQTKAASAITSSSAQLNATVNPKGTNVTNCVFEYGTTTGYGKTIGCATSPGSGIVAVKVDGPIGSGLTAGTEYHYRISATNSTGTTKGGDATFKTS